VKKMKLFGQGNPEVRKLLKVFKIPKNFDFDEEEVDAIKNELEQHAEILRERVYPKGVMEMMESSFAASSLARLAEMKLGVGDLGAAFHCCIKSLALFDSYECNWVLLAEILATHGAFVASRRGLDFAQKVHEANGEEQPELLETIYEEIWQDKKKRVLDIIDKKQR